MKKKLFINTNENESLHFTAVRRLNIPFRSFHPILILFYAFNYSKWFVHETRFFSSTKTINVIKTFKHWIGVTGEQTAKRVFHECSGVNLMDCSGENTAECMRIPVRRLWSHALKVFTWKWITEIFCGSKVMCEFALECSFVCAVVKLTWESANWVWSSFKSFSSLQQNIFTSKVVWVDLERCFHYSGVMFY